MSSIIQDIASQYIADKTFLFSMCYMITILILLYFSHVHRCNIEIFAARSNESLLENVGNSSLK